MNETIPANPEFEYLYEEFRKSKGWQHETMANHYTGIMQEALKAVHPYLNDDSRFLDLYDDAGWDNFYEYISFRGLPDTEAGKIYFANTENVSLYKKDAETFSTKQPACDEIDTETDLPDPINDGGLEGLPG